MPEVFFLAILDEIDYHRFFFSLQEWQILGEVRMKLAFAQISQATSSFTFNGNEWFPVDEVTCSEPPHAEIRVRKKKDGSVVLLGTLEFAANLVCDRCGKPLQCPLQENFEYVFTLEEQKNNELAEIECSNGDCITVHLKEPVIDIEEILREQAFLAIPGKTLCADDCRGVCPVCGALLNSEKCSCSVDDGISPFAVLGRLRKG